MNLYIISQSTNTGYDTYSDAVVAAESSLTARRINPNGEWEEDYSSWADSPDQVTVELIGTAIEGTEEGIILASFHAG